MTIGVAHIPIRARATVVPSPGRRRHMDVCSFKAVDWFCVSLANGS